MEAYIIEVLHLILRYFHVVAGIAWIGASFYFVWLDNNLQEPPEWKKEKGIKGDLWAIHGGGFYEVAKYANGPEKMPATLHWFKWEAYTTWITGFLLLSLLYYVGADAYLLDSNKSDLDAATAIAGSMSTLVVGWFVYDFLCKSPLINNGRLFAIVMVALIALLSYVLDQFIQDRAAYIHVGAVIGTCMAGNVFFNIMPGQRYLVNEIAEGRLPDPGPGLVAKQRSTHNNYATLPLLFIMVSNHFALTYSHDYGWLVLVALFVIGMWMRHYFNLKNRGIKKPSVFISSVIAFLALMVAIAPWHTLPSKDAEANAPTVTDQQAWAVVEKHCQGCHSQTPRSTLFTAAPSGFILDNIDQVKANKDRVYNRAIVTKDMPFANMTKMTEEERSLLQGYLLQY